MSGGGKVVVVAKYFIPVTLVFVLKIVEVFTVV